MNTPAAQARLQQALASQRHGRLDQAESICREILADSPKYFHALHLLGIIESQKGNAAGAADLISKAIKLNPNDASAHSNLGNVLLDLKRPEEALASYERALAREPDLAGALNGRGNALLDLKRPEQALASYERALSRQPDHAEALNNRGNALLNLDRPGEALASYERALTLEPDFAGAFNGRGNALLELKRPVQALASYERALELEPDYLEALNNRGIVLMILGRPEEALASHDRALAMDPDHIDALHGRSIALRNLGRVDEALAGWGRVLAIKPDHADALYARAGALGGKQSHEEAVADFKRLLAVSPDHDYARGWLLDMQLQCCEWADYGQSVAQITEDVRAGRRADFPFKFTAISGSPADQLRCSRVFAADNFPAASQPVWRGERYRHDRIRLAYLSADFQEHVMAYCLAELFEKHDRARFEITGISLGPDVPSRMRLRLQQAFERFVDARRKNDREVANMLRELEIDIAVDLNGYTTGGPTGIFALRAAPLQVNYLGYPGTMGTDYFDYILADRWVIPEQDHGCYTEDVVYLPDSYQVNESKRRIADRIPTRAEAGLPEQAFVFCSFNNNCKLSPMVFDVWMRLLEKVEDSVLWLYVSNAAAARNVTREAAHRGITPDRLVFASKTYYEVYLARLQLADLALDTLPYNGHATTSDALWAGLPVLTCLGTTFAGRVAASVLNAVGLPGLIARSLPEYQALALELATHPARLADLRAKLARNRATCPLFDTDRFRRHIESAYVTMWERHQRGVAPASFSVQPVG